MLLMNSAWSFRRHLGADENRQMADFGIDGVEDPLAAFP